MKGLNRELIVVVGTNGERGEEFDDELRFLQKLLEETEKTEVLFRVIELVDIHHRRISRSAKKLGLTIRFEKLPPFIFLHCLN